MFYILSKVLFFLLIPGNWIGILLLCFWLTKKAATKRWLVRGMLAVAIIFSNTYLHHKAVLALEVPPIAVDSVHPYQAGIMLGGLAMFDKHEQGFFGSASDRFTQTLKLYKKGVIQKIVITGGSNAVLRKEPSEADFVYKEMLACGVPAADIVKENKSINTFENAVFTKRILDSLHINPPYLLISSATHLRRAVRVFEKAKIPVTPYAAAFEEVDYRLFPSDYLIPDFSLLFKWSTVLKETIGLVVYQLTGKA